MKREYTINPFHNVEETRAKLTEQVNKEVQHVLEHGRMCKRCESAGLQPDPSWAPPVKVARPKRIPARLWADIKTMALYRTNEGEEVLRLISPDGRPLLQLPFDRDKWEQAAPLHGSGEGGKP